MTEHPPRSPRAEALIKEAADKRARRQMKAEAEVLAELRRETMLELAAGVRALKWSGSIILSRRFRFVVGG